VQSLATAHYKQRLSVIQTDKQQLTQRMTDAWASVQRIERLIESANTSDASPERLAALEQWLAQNRTILADLNLRHLHTLIAETALLDEILSVGENERA
jgi:hypothetical protein